MKKNIIIFFLVFLLMPSVVNAGGSSDDTTYTWSATYDTSKYKYANAVGCYGYDDPIKVGSVSLCILQHYQSGVTSSNFNDYDWTGNYYKVDCDLGYEHYATYVTQSPSDGKKYYGLGCRQPKSENDVTITKELVGYVGDKLDAEVDAHDINFYECVAIFGAEHVVATKYNECWFDAASAGEVIIQKYYDGSYVSEYYKYTIINPDTEEPETSGGTTEGDDPDSSVEEEILDEDENYYYGNVDRCYGSYVSKVKFKGKYFCATTLRTLSVSSLTCEDDGYEAYEHVFRISGSSSNYKGYGCRKAKNNDKLPYEKREIYIGQFENIDDIDNWSTTECSIISGGEYGYLEKDILGELSCKFVASKVGTVRLKVFNTKNSQAKYYEYSVLNAPTGISMLDPNYKYCDVDKCSLIGYAGSRGYELGNKVLFSGYKFCGTTAASYSSSNVTCLKKGYDPFELTFSAGGKVYKGYGCRKLKNTNDLDADADIIERDFTFCTEVGLLKTFRLIGYAFIILKILIPLLLIIFGAIDMSKAVVAGDEKAIKNAATMLMTRAIAGVIIFFIPTIIDFAAGLIAEWTNRKTEFENCQTCIFDTDDCSTIITDLEK